MKRHLLMLAAAASILTCASITASAQDDSDTLAMQQSEQAQQDPMDERNPDTSDHGMMRHCMRQCMSGDSMMGRPTMRHGGMRGAFAMRIIFALMDSDGDGTISLEEFQAAHERIFKAMDADKDGTVSLEEMENFLHAGGQAAPHH